MPLTEAHLTSLSGAAAGKSPLLSGKRLRFLATKLVPPASLGRIDRPRLLGIAGQLPARRLAVIKAPSGFGKTSLAAIPVPGGLSLD
jgi:LuxR family transcriptional regulator, maltose regulon positive regulatory protein